MREIIRLCFFLAYIALFWYIWLLVPYWTTYIYLQERYQMSNEGNIYRCLDVMSPIKLSVLISKYKWLDIAMYDNGSMVHDEIYFKFLFSQYALCVTHKHNTSNVWDENSFSIKLKICQNKTQKTMWCWYMRIYMKITKPWLCWDFEPKKKLNNKE